MSEKFKPTYELPPAGWLSIRDLFRLTEGHDESYVVVQSLDFQKKPEWKGKFGEYLMKTEIGNTNIFFSPDMARAILRQLNIITLNVVKLNEALKPYFDREMAYKKAVEDAQTAFDEGCIDEAAYHSALRDARNTA